MIAERMKLPFYKYSCSRDSSVHDLIGYKQPTSETYLETTFLKCYEEGGIFFVDEYDAMSGDMSLFFNGIADGSKFISVPHRDSKPTATKHKDFYLIMAGNTWGKGSHEYSGRDFQDCALMDRFRLCRHTVGYHIQLEKKLAGPHYSKMEALRTALESIGSYLSTRNVEDMSNMLRANYSMPTVWAWCTK
jgi:MoxR-like ATPase